MSHNNEVIGLTELRKGFLYLIISPVIGLIAVVIMYVALLFTSIPSLIVGGVLAIIAAALSIYAIFVKTRSGFRYLSRVDSQFRISYTGTTLLIVGLVVMVVSIIALIATLPSLSGTTAYPSGSLYDYLLSGTAITSLVVLILGAIIAIVGQILAFIIGAFRLHGRYHESLYLVAGILYIIALIVPIIFSLIAAILMYVALGTTISKLTMQ